MGGGRPRRASAWRRLAALAVAAPVAAGALAFEGWRRSYPADRVDLAIDPPPPGVEVFALIADDPDGGQPLAFYNESHAAIPWSALLVPFIERGEGIRDVDGDGRLDLAVRWQDAPRYGLLASGRDRRLRVWWLAPGDLAGPSSFGPLPGRSASARWPAAAGPRPPSPGLRGRLGVGDDGPPSP